MKRSADIRVQKGFLPDVQRRAVLYLKVLEPLSPKTVVCDWWLQVTLIIHWLCPFDSGCQLPLAGFASCHLLHQVSMTFLFKGSHPSLIAAHTGPWWLQPFPHPLESLSCFLSFSVHGSIHSTTADTFLWVACQTFDPQQNQAHLTEKQKQKLC